MLSVAITRFLSTNSARKKWKHALTRDDRSKRRNARFASEQGVSYELRIVLFFLRSVRRTGTVRMQVRLCGILSLLMWPRHFAQFGRG